MLLKKDFPEEDELVLCTVTKVQYNSIFAKLDEYDKVGMIYIAEVSPGRIRNIRDFVVEGKKIVCKVLRVDKEKGHIDLSLRRVTETQRRNKINSIKQEQIAEKIVEMVAKKLNTNFEKLCSDLSSKISEEYLSFYTFFEDVAKNKGLLEEIGLQKEIENELYDAIKSRIKEPIVKIGGELSLVSYAPNGIAIIKEALVKASEPNPEKIRITYEGAGKYRLVLEAPNYKEAEKLLEKSTSAAIDSIKKQKGEGSFARAEQA